MYSVYYYKIGVIESRNQAFGLLTYSSKTKLNIGSIVKVPYGRFETTGVVFSKTKKPSFDSKEVVSLLSNHGFSDLKGGQKSETPESGSKLALPANLLHTLQWLSEYYVTNISSIVANALPKGLDKKRRAIEPEVIGPKSKQKLHTLNTEQQQAIKTISKSNEPIILHGVTGSGKTRVYLEIARQVVASGKSVMVLTPEIGLAPQLVNVFREQFPEKVIVTHSGLTESERHKAWLDAATDEPLIIIGTRSALFSPIPNLGTIIIDEFHDQAFKQTQTPKYDAINVAAVRASFSKAQLILGSATPDVSRYYRSKELNRPIVELTKTANKIARPTIETVDMTDSANRHSKPWLSHQLEKTITSTLQSKKQILIFHNRRGSAPLMLCDDCGWRASCSRCHLPMTLHADAHKMRCHVCDMQDSVPVNCPDCGQPDVVTKGFGTKQIVADLENLFPSAKIGRFDTDNTKDDSLQKRYSEIKNGNIDILVGTQMLTKGLDLPHLEAVGVVLAEAGLSLPDYISNERVFQQIHQVIGRVGRHSDNNKIIIQTYSPESQFMTCVKKDDWYSFYANEVHQRQKYSFPPFTHLLLVKNDYVSRKSAQESANKFAAELRNIVGIEVLGPTPAFHERIRNRYKWQLVIKSTNRKKLQEIAKNLPSSGKWQFNLDPASLL